MRIAGLYLFQDVASSSSHHAGEERLVVGEAGQHQADQIGHQRSDIAADLDTAAAFQANVKDGDVWLGQRDPFHGFGRRGCLADNLDVVVRFEQQADSLPDHLVVVEEEDSDCHSAIVPALATRAFTFVGSPVLLRLCPGYDEERAISQDQRS